MLELKTGKIICVCGGTEIRIDRVFVNGISIIDMRKDDGCHAQIECMGEPDHPNLSVDVDFYCGDCDSMHNMSLESDNRDHGYVPDQNSDGSKVTWSKNRT